MTDYIQAIRKPLTHKSFRVFLIFFILFAAQALSWSIGVPLLSSSDEPAHIMTAAADARGQLIKKPVLNWQSPEAKVVIPKTFAVTEQESFCYSLSYQPSNCKLSKAQCAEQFNTDNLPCSLSLLSDHTATTTATYTGNYPPMYYVVTGLPTLVSSSYKVMYFMRFMSVLMGAFFIALAFFIVYKWSTNPIMFAGVSLSLAPAVTYLVGMVNPSGLEISAAISFWVAGTIIAKERFKEIPRHLLGAVSLSAVALTLSRQDGPEWLLISTVILLMIANRGLFSKLLKNKIFPYLVGIVAVVFVIAMAWIVDRHSTVVLAGQTYPRGTGMFFIAQSVLSNSRIFINEMIGQLGWNNAPVPFLTILIWYIGLGCLVVCALTSTSKKQWRNLVGLLGLIAAVVFIPVIYTIIYAHKYGDILQGRYMLPGAVGITIIAAALAKDVVAKSISLTKTIIVLVAIGNVAAYGWVLRQYVAGVSSYNILKKLPGGWTPPVPAIFLIIVSFVINICIVLYIWKLIDGNQEKYIVKPQSRGSLNST
jgi:hypothetical protein